MLQRLKDIACRVGLTAARCPVCSKLTDRDCGTLCPGCTDNLAPRTGGYCPGCGDIFGEETAPPTLCVECRDTPKPWTRLHFHNIHAGLLRDLIIRYKFNHDLGATQLLADMAYGSLTRTDHTVPDAIVPVPLHARRLLQRGFNQSAELSRILGRRLGRPVLSNGLSRIRNTIPQTQLDRKERQENIKAAFTADPELVRGKTILLLDDVYTTGATLTECAQTLNRAGAGQVDALVLARTFN